MNPENAARARLLEHYQLTIENAVARAERLRERDRGEIDPEERGQIRLQITRWEDIMFETQTKLDRIRAALKVA